MSSGLNPEPLAVYSVADRFMCGICGGTPQVSSNSTAKDSSIDLTLSCCGKTLRKSFTRHDLKFVQVIFDTSGE